MVFETTGTAAAASFRAPSSRSHLERVAPRAAALCRRFQRRCAHTPRQTAADRRRSPLWRTARTVVAATTRALSAAPRERCAPTPQRRPRRRRPHRCPRRLSSLQLSLLLLLPRSSFVCVCETLRHQLAIRHRPPLKGLTISESLVSEKRLPRVIIDQSVSPSPPTLSLSRHRLFSSSTSTKITYIELDWIPRSKKKARWMQRRARIKTSPPLPPPSPPRGVRGVPREPPQTPQSPPRRSRLPPP